MDQNTMKKIGREMSILMSIAVSLTLSLCGTLLSGHFTIGGFLLSFAVSLAISLVLVVTIQAIPIILTENVTHLVLALYQMKMLFF